MDHKLNLSHHRSRKSRSPQLTRKNDASECETFKETSSRNPKLTESSLFSDFDRRKSQNQSFSGHRFPRRPSTVSEGFEKKIDRGERDVNRSSFSCKSFPAAYKNVGCEQKPVMSGKERKQSPVKINGKEGTGGEKKTDCPNFAEGVESISLLSLAVSELEKMLEASSLAREELRKKMIDEIRCEKKSKKVAESERKPARALAEKAVSVFEDYYGSTLEEIFQAWAHLFYFIINLRINLIQLLSSSGTEQFEPKADAEKEIIVQAIECVKLFSKMKLKSIGDSLKEFCLPIKRGASETQINSYEERLSSSFLFEMDFIRKKAKELLKFSRQ